MASRSTYAGPSDVSFNMTPLIDVTFQLIIFFLLVGQFASLEKLQLEPPAPLEPLMIEDPTETAVLNIAAYPPDAVAANPSLEGQPYQWMISTIPNARTRPGETATVGWLEEKLTEALETAQANNPGLEIGDFKLEIRADRGIHYGDVQMVFRAASQMGLQKMNIVAERQE
jgi:biopolymer transport protein ExbD